MPEEDVEVDSEMESFQVWSFDVCGVAWKVPKDKHAAQLQFMIGFWWDSPSLTICASLVLEDPDYDVSC